MQKEGSPLESGLLSHAFTAVIAASIACFLPPVRIGFGSAGVILVLGIFQVGLATILLAYGIKRITALQCILVAGIEPVLNPVWVFLATGELPGPASIAGGSIILVAVTLSSAVSTAVSSARSKRR
jgi:drug/metabolite transporter (DMT)-like permease